MNIPLILTDLSIWLAVAAIILIITSELLAFSQEYSTRILIDRTRLRIAGVICGIAFIVTVILQIAIILGAK